MIYRNFFCSLLFWLGLLASSPAQKVLWLHEIGKEDGISNTTYLYSVFQDSEGFTWMGTESGLDKYDGHHFVNYIPNPTDSNGLAGNRVRGKFFEDRRKNLWFCNDAAIQCYRRQSDDFDTFRVLDSRGLPIQSGYQAIYLEKDSLLWVSAGRDLYYFNIHSLQPSKPVAKSVFDIEIFPGVSKEGKIRYFFSVDGSKSPGLEVLEITPERALQNAYVMFDGAKRENPSLNVHDVLYESDKVVWLATDSAIYKWNLQTRNYQQFPTGRVQPKFITPLDQDRFIVTELQEGAFYFNKRSGRFSSIICRLLQNPDRDIRSKITQTYVDPRGNFWFELDRMGLLYGHPEKVKFGAIPKFPSWDGTTNYVFRTMLQGPKQRIWCSTFYNGIFLLDSVGNLLRHYHPQNSIHNSLSSRQINHMLLDRNQRLWVATKNGVSYLNAGMEEFIPIRDEKGQPVPYVAYLHQLKNGEILASTLQQGIYRIRAKNDSWCLQQILPPNSNGDIYTTIYEDELGSIFVGHNMAEISIFNYNDRQLEKLITKDIRGDINGFYEAPDNKMLWIATSYGLAQLDKTNLRAPPSLFGPTDGLPDPEVLGMASDRNQDLWLSTNSGITRFDPDSLHFRNFHLADGLQSREFYNLSVLRHQNGSIWFGGDNGITLVDPEQVRPLSHQPIIQITDIKVNDRKAPGLADAANGNTNVNSVSQLVQKYRDNTLSFSFVAIDYSAPSATQLQYRMEGVDKDWVTVEAGEPGFARYPRLPAGNYNFKVRAANSDGLWSDAQQLLAVTIKPPWYWTWWAVGGYLIIGIAILIGIYRYRLNKIRKAEAFKRREAEIKQRIAETETAVLRLQMNPHFIFNSMNSISSYIADKDIDTANDYLDRFARLMRVILISSERPLQEIAEEVELLTLYLQTEAMRFENAINYSFHIDEAIDPDEVFVPTMILQPFIENAIWHGLAPKQGEKSISVAFALKGGKLHCSVEDNGIGRHAAAQLKASRPGHESKALSITRRRLELLEAQYGAPTDLNIIDLTDNSGRPTGTKVSMELPHF